MMIIKTKKMMTTENQTPFALRRASEADIPLIRRLAEEAFPATYAEIITPEQVDYMMEWMYGQESLLRQMEQERHVYFIGYAGSEPVGYVSVQPLDDEPGLWELQKLYVLPSRQGQGYGRRLFEHALGYARGLGGKRVELHVNRHNRAYRFYCRMGMKPLRSGDFSIGHGYYMNDYIMGVAL